MTSIRMLKNRHRFVDPSVAAFSQWLPHQAKENEASISSIRRCRVNSSARGKAGRFVPLHTRIFSSRNTSMRNRPSSPLPTCIAIRGPRGNAKSHIICPIHVNGNHVKLFTPIFASQFIMSMHHPSKQKHISNKEPLALDTDHRRRIRTIQSILLSSSAPNDTKKGLENGDANSSASPQAKTFAICFANRS